MQYVKPDYFDDFKCIADKCPDTCCAGWKIMIDENALQKYEGDRSVFGSRLANGIDWQESSFSQNNGRCSMLNDNNLCDLITFHGEDWLCETCHRYPRHVEEFEGLREWSLSLSCPVAAEIMLNNQKPVRFLTEEDNEEDPLAEEFEDFDFLLFTQLAGAREVLFSIVQNRVIPMEHRLSVIMDMAREMQVCLDEERLFDMDEIIDRYAEKANARKQNALCERMPEKKELQKEERYEQLKQGFIALTNLERLREDWTEVLVQAENTLYAHGYEEYRIIYDAFCRKYIEAGEEQYWEIFQEQILMFFLYTYFCGAVYDDCIYSKVALAVFSVCFIQEFVMCSWYLADKYIDKQECIRLAYRYAREVEHSDENLVCLEEWLLANM